MEGQICVDNKLGQMNSIRSSALSTRKNEYTQEYVDDYNDDEVSVISSTSSSSGDEYGLQLHERSDEEMAVRLRDDILGLDRVVDTLSCIGSSSSEEEKEEVSDISSTSSSSDDEYPKVSQLSHDRYIFIRYPTPPYI